MLDNHDRDLLKYLQAGLPICSRPYAAMATECGLSEADVIARLTRLKQNGIIKRLGVIVKHAAVGYHANAMIVWNIPDEQVNALGEKISQFAFVTLCYQRPKQPEWAYNLYCMIHGKDRATVLAQLAQLNTACGLTEFDCQVLFSRRCFKQRGAVYLSS
jgi:DNA-binding Lrp family transcriptional regulator